MTERVWRCYDREMGRNEWTSDPDVAGVRSTLPDEWVVHEFRAVPSTLPPVAPAGDREAVAWPIEARRLLDAAQQAVIGFGMGWDMDGFIDSLRTQSEAATKLGVEPSQDHYPTALSRARTGSEAQNG